MEDIKQFVDEQTLRANCEGEANKRIAVYDEAISQEPHVYLIYNRGNAKLDSGRPEDAIVDYNEVIRLTPEDGDAYYNRGLAKARLQRFAEALEDYDISLKLQPGESSTFYNKACVYAQIDQLETCLSFLKMAFELNTAWIQRTHEDSDFDKIRHESAFAGFMNQYPISN